MREQAVGLEHHAHVAPAGRHVGDVAAIEQDAAGIQPLQPGERAQRRGLAAARGAEQRDQLARRQIERQAVERADLAEAATQLDELDAHAGARRAGAGHGRGGARASGCRLIGPLTRTLARPLWSMNDSRNRSAGRQQQRCERDRDRDARIALAEQVDHDLQGLEVQERRDRELAQHQGDRDERCRHDRAHDVGHDDPPDHAEPGAAEAAAGLGEGDEVERAETGGQRPVGERQHQDDVDEGERVRGFAEQAPYPSVDRGEADHQHDGRDRQRQEADELDHAQELRQAELHPDHGRHQQDEHHDDGEQRPARATPGSTSQQVVVGADRDPGGEAALTADAARRELQHRDQRQEHVDADREENRPAQRGRAERAPTGSAAHRSHREVLRCSMA